MALSTRSRTRDGCQLHCRDLTRGASATRTQELGRRESASEEKTNQRSQRVRRRWAHVLRLIYSSWHTPHLVWRVGPLHSTIINHSLSISLTRHRKLDVLSTLIVEVGGIPAP